MNYKRHKMHSSQSCGLCKPNKRFGRPKIDRQYLIEQYTKKDIAKLMRDSHLG